MKLRECIQNNELNSILSVLIDKLKKDYLPFWQIHAPHYTDHGERHCENVERKLDEIIPESIKKDLNQYEVFILLCSVWLHDIGMMVCEEGESIEDVRLKHHQRAPKVIYERFSELFNESERAVIGEIARAHRDIDVSTLDETRTLERGNLGSQKIRIQLLAALLRLADACDIIRTSSSLSKITTLPEEAKFYHSLYTRISGIAFEHGRSIIEVDMLAENESEKEVLRKFVVDKIRSELQSIQEVLMNNGIHYFKVNEKFCKPPESMASIKVPPEMMKKIQEDMSADAHSALIRGDAKRAFEACKRIHILGGSVAWEIFAGIATLFEDAKDFKSEAEVLEFGLRFYPNEAHLLRFVGALHFDRLFNWEKAYEHYKKAYEIDPTDEGGCLSYAEICISCKKYDKADQLATQVTENTSDLRMLINAKLIQIWVLYLTRKEKEGSEAIKALTMMMPRNFHEHNKWSYNGISKFLAESSLQQSVKNKLLGLIDMVKNKALEG